VLWKGRQIWLTIFGTLLKQHTESLVASTNMVLTGVQRLASDENYEKYNLFFPFNSYIYISTHMSFFFFFFVCARVILVFHIILLDFTIII
jgi:hypothetical protein